MGAKTRAATERLQRTVKAVGGGGLLAVGLAVGAGVGVWECLWGRVRAAVLGGRGPPSLQATPWACHKDHTLSSCTHQCRGLELK